MLEDKPRKLICPKCGQMTNHKKVWNGNEEKWEDVGSQMWQTITFELFQCLGCETPTLVKTDIFSENFGQDPETGEIEIIPIITRWPKTSSRMRKQKDFLDTPYKVKRIYQETIEAYNAELPTLCAAGTRAIVEAICNEEGIKADVLEKKIEGLKAKGAIPEAIIEGLHQSRALGNAAVHETALFGDAELQAALDLIENLIESKYESQSKVELLKSRLKK